AVATRFVGLGGSMMVMLAVAVLPSPASTEVTFEVTLFFAPPVVAVTLTVKVHEAPAARAAPDKLMLPDPAAAVMVPAPHAPVRPFGVATKRPAGRLSVKPTPVSVVDVFGFVIVNVRDVIVPAGMPAVPKPFLIAGGHATLRLAAAVPPGPPCTDCTLPGA